MRTLSFLSLFLAVLPLTALADPVEQSDWSGGGGVAGPVVTWGDRFDSSSAASWLAVPGQVALSSARLAPPVPHVLGTGTQAFGVRAGDLDDDGDLDVIGAYDFLGLVVIWWNDGANPPAWTLDTLDATLSHPQMVFPADLDGDGDIDIVGNATDTPNGIVYWRNDGGAPIAWSRFDVDTDWPAAFELFVDDVDRDGRPDILSGSWTEGEAAWWRNGGGHPIAWTRVTVDSLLAGAHSVKSGDFDGDGDVDIVAAAGQVHQITWYRNDDGAGTAWTKSVIRENYVGARSVCVGDIDADGDLDFAGTSWTSDVSWWRNDGGSPIVWTEQVLDSLFDGGHYVDVADLDGDGRLDILAAAFVLNDVKWWRNGGGDPIAWTRYNVERNLFGAVTSRAADLDGDGALEVLGAGYSGGGGFAWYEIAYFLPAGSLTSSILDLGSGCAATGIDWTAEMPAGTDVRFQVRGSPDPGDLGAWSADILTPGSFPAPVGRYVQYRAVLATSDSTRSPIVRSVRLARDATGVEGGPPPLLGSLSVRPNPFNPEAAITFVLDRGGPVRVSIHDIAGREIARLDDRTLPAGTHGLVWTGDDAGGRPVPSGAYFVRVETVAARLSEKLLLIR
jgi:hypothetical protein